MFVVLHPSRVLGECTDHTAIQPAFGAVVDVFHASGTFQARGLEPPGQHLVLPPGPLLIDQQRQAVQKAQLPRGGVLFLLSESFDHPLQPERLQFFHHRLL